MIILYIWSLYSLDPFVMMKEFFIWELVGDTKSTRASGKLFKMWLRGLPGTLPTEASDFDLIEVRVGDLLEVIVPVRERGQIEAAE